MDDPFGRFRRPSPPVPIVRAPITETQGLENLDAAHLGAVRRAVTNLLDTQLAELTYAQIIDGLPTLESLDEPRKISMERLGHPVARHNTFCDGIMEKLQGFRSKFDIMELRFEPQTLQAFQETQPASRDFLLRLIELVVVACHQIAAYLYENGEEKHREEYAAWRADFQARQDAGDERVCYGPTQGVAPFFHGAYLFHEQYPRGVSDMVGYWAELVIFGGVVVFDRGPSDTECNQVLFHGGRTATIWPLTDSQFDSLTSFLLSDSKDIPCPLPFHPGILNRPRYTPWHAMRECHIFRNRYERRTSSTFQWSHTKSAGDFPEIGDWMWLFHHLMSVPAGRESLDEAKLREVNERLLMLPPSHPPQGCGGYSWDVIEEFIEKYKHRGEPDQPM